MISVDHEAFSPKRRNHSVNSHIVHGSDRFHLLYATLDGWVTTGMRPMDECAVLKKHFEKSAVICWQRMVKFCITATCIA